VSFNPNTARVAPNSSTRTIAARRATLKNPRPLARQVQANIRKRCLICAIGYFPLDARRRSWPSLVNTAHCNSQNPVGERLEMNRHASCFVQGDADKHFDHARPMATKEL